MYQNTLRRTETWRPDVLTQSVHAPETVTVWRRQRPEHFDSSLTTQKYLIWETKRHSVLVPVFQPKLRRVNFYIRGQQLNYTHLNMNKTQDQSMIQRETSLNCFISNSSLHPHSPTRLVKTEIRRTHFPVLISSPVISCSFLFVNHQIETLFSSHSSAAEASKLFKNK